MTDDYKPTLFAIGLCDGLSGRLPRHNLIGEFNRGYLRGSNFRRRNIFKQHTKTMHALNKPIHVDMDKIVGDNNV
jgi:hypothetical protein